MIALSVVIPVYNEKENLPELIDRTLATCRGSMREFEIIFVDDGSKDGSREILREASVLNPEIKVVMLNRNYGQHAAVFAGLEESAGDAVVTLDADLQNPPEEIPRLLDELDKGIDVVGTVRQNRQDTFFRRAASSLVNSVAARATGVSMRDYGCMLRGYSRMVVNAMIGCDEHSTFIPVLANSFAGSTIEIPVKHSARTGGDSKYGLFKLISLQFDMLTSMSTFPLRMLSLMGGVISMLGIGFGVLLAVLRLAYGPIWAANGIFTLFAVLFVFIGAQFIGLGLLGEYIGRIYHDVRGRPRFFVKEICGRPKNI
ncbi:undecaprenyl-phosphate 4-deoxy-4-formamido-L-arabinose transferase [Synergistales bacterium]|nr:undecaprenyl-phosphate 4-deoxy-4-formamido-L-arabinose transferase [Synergistales bacterium]